MVRNDVTNKFTFAGIAMKFEMNVRLNAATKLSFTLCLMTELLIFLCGEVCVKVCRYDVVRTYRMSGFCFLFVWKAAARKREQEEREEAEIHELIMIKKEVCVVCFVRV